MAQQPVLEDQVLRLRLGRITRDKPARWLLSLLLGDTNRVLGELSYPKDLIPKQESYLVEAYGLLSDVFITESFRSYNLKVFNALARLSTVLERCTCRGNELRETLRY